MTSSIEGPPSSASSSSSSDPLRHLVEPETVQVRSPLLIYQNNEDYMLQEEKGFGDKYIEHKENAKIFVFDQAKKVSLKYDETAFATKEYL
jgi:hypothetical protein